MSVRKLLFILMIRLSEILTELHTGRPLKQIVYRGDDTDFNAFDHKFIGRATMSNTEGFWFSSDPEAAQYFGQLVRKFEITMNNPLVFTDEDFRQTYHGPPHFARLAKQRGHDGVVIKNIVDGDMVSDVYCVWNIEQIKKL